jgi:hypothetical protein
MKLAVRTLLCAAFGLCAMTAFAGAPKVDAARATRMATDYLAKLGGNAPHIVSVNLERTALVNGEDSWVIRFSEPIVEGNQREIGVRVRMDGVMAHIVEDGTAKRQRANRRPVIR